MPSYYNLYIYKSFKIIRKHFIVLPNINPSLIISLINNFSAPPAKVPRLDPVQSSFPVGTVLEGELPREEVTAEVLNSREEREEKKLAIAAMSKKRKRLYSMIMRSRSKRAKQVEELKKRRRDYDELHKNTDEKLYSVN